MNSVEFEELKNSLIERIMLLPGTGSMTREDVADVIACGAQPNAQELFNILIADYTAAAKIPAKNWWQSVLDIFTPISAFANLILPVASLIELL